MIACSQLAELQNPCTMLLLGLSNLAPATLKVVLKVLYFFSIQRLPSTLYTRFLVDRSWCPLNCLYPFRYGSATPYRSYCSLSSRKYNCLIFWCGNNSLLTCFFSVRNIKFQARYLNAALLFRLKFSLIQLQHQKKTQRLNRARTREMAIQCAQPLESYLYDTRFDFFLILRRK